MEPKKSSSKSQDLKGTLQPMVRYSVDTDDYFELAYEPDEFGVHVPDPGQGAPVNYDLGITSRRE
jgi:hypothetical protein